MCRLHVCIPVHRCGSVLMCSADVSTNTISLSVSALWDMVVEVEAYEDEIGEANGIEWLRSDVLVDVDDGNRYTTNT
jgi:hypothetical protein